MSSNSASAWELVDDDGFIFKRRRDAKPCPPKLDDGAEKEEELKRSAQAQERFREILARRKKVAMLEAQKSKYKAEIDDWQRLLSEEEGARIRPQQLTAIPPEVHEVSEEVGDGIEILELQVDACEGLVRQLKSLRDRGEQMRSMLEKTANDHKSRQFQSLIEEVALLQNSPRFLIQGLISRPAPLGIEALAVSTEVGRLLAQSPA